MDKKSIKTTKIITTKNTYNLHLFKNFREIKLCMNLVYELINLLINNRRFKIIVSMFINKIRLNNDVVYKSNIITNVS